MAFFRLKCPLMMQRPTVNPSKNANIRELIEYSPFLSPLFQKTTGKTGQRRLLLCHTFNNEICMLPIIHDNLNPLAAYDYVLPQELIANAPANPRDSARLLVHHRASGQTAFVAFAHITHYLPKNAVLVLNETKVIPARFHCTEDTGGNVGMLYLSTNGDTMRVLAEGKLNAGDKLQWQDEHSFTVLQRDEKEAILQPSFPIETLHELLERYGETPLPPYIKHSPLSEPERRREYQTVFAETPGSVAAPTAGLHFTEALLEKIRAHGCNIQTVTLHVNLGTFAPLTEEHLRTRTLHEETYEISPKTAALLNGAKEDGRPIIAVGTTVVRTLESAVRNGTLAHLAGTTRLFLSPENPPVFVDGLITNFHVPRSSLLMLVAAFVGREKLLSLYAEAIQE